MRSLLAAAALAAALPAGAAAPRLLVASLKAPPRLTFTGKSAADAIAREAGQAGTFEVAGPEELERRHGRAAAQRLTDCADDARCLADVARSLGADRVVAGWLSQTETTYLVGVVLVDVRTGEAVASFTREVPIASRKLQAELAAATPALLRGEMDLPGTLAVLSNVDGAEVSVNDQPVGRTPVNVRLKPGRHQVQVSKAGYMRQEPHWVVVSAGETTVDEVRLLRRR